MIGHIITVGMHVLIKFVRSHRVAVGNIGNYLFSTFAESYPKAVKSVEEGIMSTKHLKKGDPLPPFNGTVRVYNMRFCPYAQRTILALNAKKVPYEIVNIDLIDKPDWLFVKSPLGKVPSIETADGVIVYESLITADYVDEIYPQRPLHSKDPLRKAHDRIIVDRFNSVVSIFFKAVFKPEPVDDDVVNSFHGHIETIQTELQKRGTKFLSGDEPGMPDYMIWPWFERLGLIEKFAGDRFKLDGERFSTLYTWIEDMKRDPAIKDYLLDPKYHIKYLETRMAGKPDFDMPLPNKL